MNNVFQTSLRIHERYDLKGSTLGRCASEDEKKKENPILKDLDVSTNIYLGKEKTDVVLKQLESDCGFLRENLVMDYSLLLGVHRIGDDHSSSSLNLLTPKGRVRSVSATCSRTLDLLLKARQGTSQHEL
jgi:1-phosphatidylinositol-4-phosphate 5-kinase